MNRRPGSHTPHFQDHSQSGRIRHEVNPYVLGHLDFPEVIPAAKATEYKGKWHEAFGREAPMHLELGAGNGFHIAGMALQNPDTNWLGLELRFKRVVLCARKLQTSNIKNAKILRYNWFYLTDLFEDASLDGLHLHHPDPWTKESQSHNRIIDVPFCQLIARLLKPGAHWRTKSDFLPHIEAIAQCVEGLPFQVLGICHDVKNEGAPWPDDVVTNYQRKSYEEGKPVHAIHLQRIAG